MIRKNSDLFFLIVAGCVVVATAAYAKKVRSKMSYLQDNLSTTTNVTKNLRSQVTGLTKELTYYRNIIKKYDQKVKEYKKELDAQNDIRNEQQQQIASLQKMESRLREQRSKYRKRMSSLEDDIRQMEEKLYDAKSDVRKAKNIKNEISSRRHRERLEREIDENEAQEEFLGMSLMEAEKEYKKYKNNVANLEKELEKTRQALASAREENQAGLENEINRLKEMSAREKSRLSEKIDFLETQIDSLLDRQETANVEKSYAQKEKERALAQLAGTTMRTQDLLDDTANMHYNLGVIFTQRNEYQKALFEYREGLKLNPKDADAHYNIAILYDDVFGDSEKALNHYQAYLRLRPNDKDSKRIKKWIIDKEAEVMVKD